MLGIGVGAAYSDAKVESIRVLPRKQEAAKTDTDWAPKVHVVISGFQGKMEPEVFTLSDQEVNPPVTVQAEKVVSYVDSDEPLALVVLIQGNEMWMGNTSYDEEEPLEGAYEGLGVALDEFSKAGPQESKGALIFYHDTVQIKQPMGELGALSGSSLGSQEGFRDNLRVSFLAGIDEAKNLLSNESGYRRALVVIGEGIGQEEGVGAKLKQRGKELKELDVEVYTIHYKTPNTVENPGERNMTELEPIESYSAVSRENFRAFASRIVKSIGARYYVDFPGEAFQWDGQAHELVVSVKGKQVGAPEFVLKQGPKPPPGEGSLWWLWLLLGIAGVFALLIIVFRNRPPRVVEAPVAEEPESTANKTVMLGVGGDDEGMPIVGWIVPLTGPNQYQTFKLLQGVTSVGSGEEANIVIDDQFMSAEHASVVCSPNGFTFNDGGSTNGSFVNEQKVSVHELVDNDVITMGRTEFKFKSIN